MVDVVAIVLTDDLVTAPFSGRRAAVVVVEALKGDDVIGTMVFGDLLRLESSDGRLDVSARRVTWSWVSMFEAPPAPERVPAELVPLLQRGATAFRERLVRRGDRLRLRYSASSDIRLDEMLSL